jgi:hypothetical protein
LLLTILIGCKKDFSPNLPQVQVPKLEVKDGVLAFEDGADFANAMGYFRSIGLEATQNLVKQLPNFRGMIEITPSDIADINRLNKALWKFEQQEIRRLDVYDDELPVEAISYDDYLIKDPYFEAALNTYREVMVEGLVIRTTEEGVFG